MKKCVKLFKTDGREPQNTMKQYQMLRLMQEKQKKRNQIEEKDKLIQDLTKTIRC